MNREHHLLFAIDGFSKLPAIKVCKSSETKEKLNTLKQNFNLYELQEKIKANKG